MSNLYTSYPIPASLNSAARAYLRSLAADMSPVTQIGKGGLTENLIATVSDALAEQLRAVVVAVIGRRIILFRRPLNPKNRRIELPGRGTV